MFLRIRNSPAWKAIMSFAIFYLVASAVITNAMQLTECRPLRMYWEKVPGGTCRSPASVQKAIIGTSGTRGTFIRQNHQNALPRSDVSALRPMTELARIVV
jgi:hypothetical protein